MRVLETTIRSLEELTEVLDEAGFGGKCEAHDEPVPLFGYMGEERHDRAHVVVRRRHLRPASNDLGFRWNLETGCYDMIFCDYDWPVARALERAHCSVRSRGCRH